jgi:hypothetical protein
LVKPKRNLIIIEPMTRIVSLGTLDYRAGQSINAAIADAIAGKDEERKKTYWKSRMSIENKRRISQFTSEVYAYLNPIISEFGEPDDYYFRLWLRVEVDRETGELVNVLHFDVDMYKYIGKVGGNLAEDESYCMKLYFVGNKDTPVYTFFVETLKKVASEISVVSFKPFDSLRMVPPEMRKGLSEHSNYLIVEKEVFEIKMRIDGTNISYFTEVAGKETTLSTKILLENFVMQKIGLKPEIGKKAISFQPVDKELKKIRTKIEDGAKEIDEPDFLKSLGIDEELNAVKSELVGVDTGKIGDDELQKIKRLVKRIDRTHEKYLQLSVEYESIIEDMKNIEKDCNNGKISYEQYDVFRMRKSIALRANRIELIKLKATIAENILQEEKPLIEEIKGKAKK